MVTSQSSSWLTVSSISHNPSSSLVPFFFPPHLSGPHTPSFSPSHYSCLLSYLFCLISLHHLWRPEVRGLTFWPSFLVYLPLALPSLMASTAIYMSMASQFISLVSFKTSIQSCLLEIPLGCYIRQERLSYALLKMTSNRSGISQKGLFLIHTTYPPQSGLVIIIPGFRLMEQLSFGTLLITV